MVKNNIMKRNPMLQKLSLGIWLTFIPVVILLIVISSDIQVPIGFLIGALYAQGIVIHMALSIEDSIRMKEDDALKYTRKNYIFRFIILIIIFLLMFFLKFGNLVSALFGIMTLKVSAYLQPFTNKVITKFTSKGR